jgi:hypothetical protein
MMRDAGGGEPDAPPSDEEIAGGPVGNSDARFVDPSADAEEEAREGVEHPGAIDSEAEPDGGDEIRP